MLLATMDELFRGSYDFFYLPIDFKNKCNVGYAFINMIQPVNIIPLFEHLNNKKWERFNSEKVRRPPASARSAAPRRALGPGLGELCLGASV
jgi:hypothetical protein